MSYFVVKQVGATIELALAELFDSREEALAELARALADPRAATPDATYYVLDLSSASPVLLLPTGVDAEADAAIAEQADLLDEAQAEAAEALELLGELEAEAQLPELEEAEVPLVYVPGEDLPWPIAPLGEEPEEVAVEVVEFVEVVPERAEEAEPEPEVVESAEPEEPATVESEVPAVVGPEAELEPEAVDKPEAAVEVEPESEVVEESVEFTAESEAEPGTADEGTKVEELDEADVAEPEPEPEAEPEPEPEVEELLVVESMVETVVVDGSAVEVLAEEDVGVALETDEISEPEPEPVAPSIVDAPPPTTMPGYAVGDSDLESLTCEDCVYVGTCPNSEERTPSGCGSFQWRST